MNPEGSPCVTDTGERGDQCLGTAAMTSVFEKSSPLNSNG
jgi:hypothetical protein